MAGILRDDAADPVKDWTLSPSKPDTPVVQARNPAEARQIFMHKMNLTRWPAGVSIVLANPEPTVASAQSDKPAPKRRNGKPPEGNTPSVDE